MGGESRSLVELRPKYVFHVCTSLPLRLCVFFYLTFFGRRRWSSSPLNVDSRVLGILFPGRDVFDSDFGISFRS